MIHVVQTIQTIFQIREKDNKITGLINPITGKKVLLIRQPKLCLWCGNVFIPHANKQQYCSREHARYATMENKAKYSRKYRRVYHDIIKEQNKVPVGTGTLGGHCSDSFGEEYEKIRDEMVRLGLREKDDKSYGGFL